MSNFHVHHKIPWAKGGLTTLENALLMCEHCHKELHKNT
jgi:5-methylcytosine-specific restriction endonuclease McrA